jgi:hypothetical protein
VVVSLGESKQRMEELLQRIDQLIDILNMISRDLSKVSKDLKSIGASTAASRTQRVESGQTLFPEDLRKMLEFEDTEKHIIIKPRGYLGSGNFAKIASIVREAGGEYISAGKESHFRISKETLE